MRIQNSEVRSFTHSRDNRGYSKKLGNLCICPCSFLPHFSRAFVPIDPVKVSAKFAVHARSWDNSDCSFGLGLQTPNLGEEGSRGSGMVPIERALVSSCRPSIVTFHLSLRVSETLPLFVLHHATFPTPPLVSPKFRHVPLGVGGWPLGYEEWRCWANWMCK